MRRITHYSEKCHFLCDPYGFSLFFGRAKDEEKTEIGQGEVQEFHVLATESCIDVEFSYSLPQIPVCPCFLEPGGGEIERISLQEVNYCVLSLANSAGRKLPGNVFK